MPRKARYLVLKIAPNPNPRFASLEEALRAALPYIVDAIIKGDALRQAERTKIQPKAKEDTQMSQLKVQFNKRIVGIPALRTSLGPLADQIINSEAEKHQETIKARLGKKEGSKNETLITRHTVKGLNGEVTFVLWSTTYRAVLSNKAGNTIWLKTAVYSESAFRAIEALLDNKGN